MQAPLLHHIFLHSVRACWRRRRSMGKAGVLRIRSSVPSLTGASWRSPILTLTTRERQRLITWKFSRLCNCIPPEVISSAHLVMIWEYLTLMYLWRWVRSLQRVGQAELYHAHVTWWYPEYNEDDLKMGTEYVLKVFKKGTLLRHLQSQWPLGYMQFHAEEVVRTKLGKPGSVRYTCDVMYGTLLKDGRFAFLVERETEDLRTLIDRCMKLRAGQDCGPFQEEDGEGEVIMYQIAVGMDWLHSRNIVHRDLKASNVLVTRYNGSWACFVADFECSIGVVGTGFFRAPEILQACKDEDVSRRPEVFTKEVDVYSYGMTCYEIFLRVIHGGTMILSSMGNALRCLHMLLNGHMNF